MQFIDTHSHLYSSKFDKDRSKVVADAVAKGVKKILLPNISSKYTKSMLSLCDEFPENCLPMMGLHPCDVTEKNYDQEITHVEEQLATQNYIAVGEIGLDLYWNKTTFKIQKKAFIRQIELAKKYDLPIVIHVRDSFNEAFEIINRLNHESLRGVFHCFTGNVTDAQKIISLQGFYLGIGGVLTFKNSELDKTIAEIDLRHLVLETDSPYLTPNPFRGKRNESKYLITIAEHLAQIHKTSIGSIAEITTKNAKTLFRI